MISDTAYFLFDGSFSWNSGLQTIEDDCGDIAIGGGSGAAEVKPIVHLL